MSEAMSAPNLSLLRAGRPALTSVLMRCRRPMVGGGLAALFGAALIGAALLGAATPALAATPAAGFPSRPITIIVTFPPGGGTDLLARKLGALLERSLGSPVIVENRPGASGNIGASLVARAAPDGHTLLMVNSSFAINPGVLGPLDFSPKQDFAPIINVAMAPSVLVVPAASGIKTLPDALSRAGAAGKPLLFASCGNGTPQHLAGEMLATAVRRPLEQVPYRGCGPALADVVSGHVELGIVTASSAAPFIAGGRLRAIAITSAERSPVLPEVPTVAEQGVPGFELDQWHGLLAPAATPAAVIARIDAVLATELRRDDVRNELRQQGFTPVSSTPQSFKAMIDRDIDRFGALTARLGLRLDTGAR